MTKTQSYSLIDFRVLSFFTLFAVFTLSGIFDQVAFAQESSEDVWLGPTTNALTAFFGQVAESLPKVIAAIILLVIGWIVATVISKVIEKVAALALKTINKDETENNNDNTLTQVTSSKGSAKLISTVVKWFVFLFFVMAAVNALEFEQLTVAMTNLWLWLPNLLAFVLIIILGMLLTKFVGKWVEHEIKEHNYGNPKYFVLAVQIIIYAIVFAIALTQLGVGQQVISILVSAYAWSIAGGIGAALAVGLGFALKEMLPAIINSQSKKRSVLKVGQKVQIGENTGTVTAVELLHIILANENNESIVIPTKDLSNKTIRVFGQVSEK
ncbi:MAG: mechanosensitive ion channel [Nitrosopumilus sp.]|nr:mechanosensitive ion channel [Nitrosopumilus sp.]MDH3502842.1 mechanosensitive ion channel [Nitrosopumilus sp.]